MILQGSNNAPIVPEKYLDEIYTTMLKQSITLGYIDKEKEELYYILK